jgi:hypothetical protein
MGVFRSKPTAKPPVFDAAAGANFCYIHLQMTPTKAERYRKLSAKAGIVCSCFVIVFFLGLVIVEIYRNSEGPNWPGIVCGIACVGSIASAVVCLSAAILARRKPNQGTDEPGA